MHHELRLVCFCGLLTSPNSPPHHIFFRLRSYSLPQCLTLWLAGKLSKGEKLGAVDHSTIDYPPFRRRFYIEVPEIQRMTEEEVAQARKTEGIKVRRHGCQCACM